MAIETTTEAVIAATGAAWHQPRLAYSVAEVVKATGLGKTTVYGLIGSGALPSCKIGKRRIIRHADLEQLIRSKLAA